MTMWPSAAMIADYLEQRLPGKDGEIHVGFTSKQRDQVVAALRLREAAVRSSPLPRAAASSYLAMTSC